MQFDPVGDCTQSGANEVLRLKCIKIYIAEANE